MTITKSMVAALCCGITATATLLLQTVAAQAAVPWATVYATDFTTDPGWTTSHPGSYHWNPGGDYTLTMVDGSQSYATIPVTLTPHQSFRFEFDVNVTRMDYAGNISVGLFGATRDAFSQSGVNPRLKFNFGNGDLGYGLGVWGYDSSNTYRELNQYPSPYQLSTPYHVSVTFDHDAATISVQVTRKSDGQVIWSNSMSCVLDFANLVYFGASVVGLNYSPGATAIATIDNVSLSQPAWIPIYATDFTVNPGWTTSHPGSYYWNSGSNTYSLTMVDGSQSYATTPVILTPHQSLRFELDLKVIQMDWAGNISFGLFGATRDAFPQSGVHPYFRINFGKGDLGYGLGAWGYDSSNTYRELNQYPSSYELNTWYRACGTFDRDAGMIAVEVKRRDNCEMLWSTSMSGVKDFANLIYFGASVVGLDYSPGATGEAEIDNVCLFESAPSASIRLSQVEICWPSRTNAVYDVQYRSSLTANLWVNLLTNIAGSAGQTCVEDAIAIGQPQKFYRVVQVTN